MGPVGSVQSDNLAPDAHYLVVFHPFLERVGMAQGGKDHAAHDERAMQRLVVQLLARDNQATFVMRRFLIRQRRTPSPIPLLIPFQCRTKSGMKMPPWTLRAIKLT